MANHPENTFNSIDSLQEALIAFADARDWAKFQSPKNLSMALTVEAGELMEHFQWLTEEASRNPDASSREHIQQELADVFMYTLLLAKRLDVDILKACETKIAINEKRYPADLVRGSAKKYTHYANASDRIDPIE